MRGWSRLADRELKPHNSFVELISDLEPRSQAEIHFEVSKSTSIPPSCCVGGRLAKICMAEV